MLQDFDIDDLKEPEIRSYKRTVLETGVHESRLHPGYIFFSPLSRPGDPLVGPHIIDQSGELVWWGNNTASSHVQNFHVCEYNGEKHLCSSETRKGQFSEQCVQRILDNTYRPALEDFHAAYPLSHPSPREFHFTKGGRTFLQTIDQLKPLDLRPYAGPEDGFIFDGCFQEIEVITGKALFSWCGLDHLPIWLSQVFLHIPENTENRTDEAYGEGTSEKPWDYLHISAVDKTSEGDYLISARHLDQIMKIAGKENVHGVKPGQILWRFGGKFNDYQSAIEVADLSRQNHVRHIQTTRNETTFSVFNNQWKASEANRRISNVQIITINNETMTTISVKKFHNPEGRLSLVQGSAQVLSNGNVLVGWGSVPHISEFDANGDLLSHMHLDSGDSELYGLANIQNYRVSKSDWVGTPKSLPKLVTYMRSCNVAQSNPLVAYVSWNGATEVRYWRFYTRTFSDFGPWMFAGRVAKEGFETKVYIRSWYDRYLPFPHQVKVQALDIRGRVLAQTVSQTFVPAREMQDYCSFDGCFSHEWFDYRANLSCADDCRISVQAVGRFLLSIWLALVGVGFAFRRFNMRISKTRLLRWWRNRPRTLGGMNPELAEVT